MLMRLSHKADFTRKKLSLDTGHTCVISLPKLVQTLNNSCTTPTKILIYFWAVFIILCAHQYRVYGMIESRFKLKY